MGSIVSSPHLILAFPRNFVSSAALQNISGSAPEMKNKAMLDINVLIILTKKEHLL